MTRKEIEKRCREEMQRNIPDKEALWKKIEAGLPDVQEPVSHIKRKLHMSSVQRILVAAACFLLIFTGVKGWQQRNRNDASDLTIAEHDAAEDTAEEYDDAADTSLLSYADLHVPDNQDIASQVNVSLLGTEGEYFNEQDVLEKTECFVDVKVIDGWQDGDTMHYTLEVIDCYGGILAEQQIRITSHSAYILELCHEYVLPLYQNGSSWNLSYECAPQIEKTQDNQYITHNGWWSMILEDSEPVLYTSYGTDDYFYDRMYLTGDAALNILLQKWESL